MKIYVQSKTGDHNATLHSGANVENMMKTVRRIGFYHDDKGRCVPFEEIQYMMKEEE